MAEHYTEQRAVHKYTIQRFGYTNDGGRTRSSRVRPHFKVSLAQPSTHSCSDSIEAREVVQNPAATMMTSQAPAATTYWIETLSPTTSTWVEIRFTQAFASVPSQGPSVLPGSIGMGTLTAVGAAQTHATAQTGASSRIDFGRAGLCAGVGAAAAGFAILIMM